MYAYIVFFVTPRHISFFFNWIILGEQTDKLKNKNNNLPWSRICDDKNTNGPPPLSLVPHSKSTTWGKESKLLERGEGNKKSCAQINFVVVRVCLKKGTLLAINKSVSSYAKRTHRERDSDFGKKKTCNILNMYCTISNRKWSYSRFSEHERKSSKLSFFFFCRFRLSFIWMEVKV